MVTIVFISEQVLAHEEDDIPWHPLNQISGDEGKIFMDADSNGTIDFADDLSCGNCLFAAEIGPPAISSSELAPNLSVY